MIIQNLYSSFTDFTDNVNKLAKGIQRIFFPIYWLISLPFITAYWLLASIVLCLSTAFQAIPTFFNKHFSSKNKSDSAKKDSAKFARMSKILNGFNDDVSALAKLFQNFTLPAFWLISLPFVATFKILSTVYSEILSCIGTVWQFLGAPVEKFPSRGTGSPKQWQRQPNRNPKSSPKRPLQKGGKTAVRSSDLTGQDKLNQALEIVKGDNAEFTERKGPEYIKQLNLIFNGLVDSVERGTSFEEASKQLKSQENIREADRGEVLITYCSPTGANSYMYINPDDFYAAIRVLMLEVRENLSLCKRKGLDSATVKGPFGKVMNKYVKESVLQNKTKQKFTARVFIQNLKYLFAIQHHCQSALCGKLLIEAKFKPNLVTLDEVSSENSASDSSYPPSGSIEPIEYR